MAKTNLKVVIEEEIRQSVYINPLTDFGFKKLFLKKELMIAFLNDIVGKNIKDIQYEPTEGLGAHPRERKAIFDILCTTQENECFIVEMQLGEQTYFRDRILFYASHAIRKQAPRKKNWNSFSFFRGLKKNFLYLLYKKIFFCFFFSFYNGKS